MGFGRFLVEQRPAEGSTAFCAAKRKTRFEPRGSALFAVHLPALDWLFGTFFLPGERWPAQYGLNDGAKVPNGYARQFWYPFRR